MRAPSPSGQASRRSPAIRSARGNDASFRKTVQTRAGANFRPPGVTCPEPDGAFYVFPNFSAYFGKKSGGRTINGSLDLADYLMEDAHVAVVPGSAFGEDNCIRFSYALSMDEIEQGFDGIKRALQKLR